MRRDTRGYVLHQFTGLKCGAISQHYEGHRNLAGRFIWSSDDRGVQYGGVGLDNVLQFRRCHLKGVVFDQFFQTVDQKDMTAGIKVA